MRRIEKKLRKNPSEKERKEAKWYTDRINIKKERKRDCGKKILL